MSDGVCADQYISFLSLLLVYLKSLEIISAGSPEVKPAKACTSYLLCYVLRSSCDLWLCVNPFLVHLSCHCSWVGFPMEPMLCYPLLLIYSLCLKGSFTQRNNSLFELSKNVRICTAHMRTHGHNHKKMPALFKKLQNKCQRHMWNLTWRWIITNFIFLCLWHSRKSFIL